jgi:hypothetical protein
MIVSGLSLARYFEAIRGCLQIRSDGQLKYDDWFPGMRSVQAKARPDFNNTHLTWLGTFGCCRSLLP